MRIRTVFVFILGLTACDIHGRRGPLVSGEARDDGGPALRVMSSKEARRSTLASKDLSVGFDEGQNGDELIDRFLRKAESKGAKQVSDIAVYLVTGQGDSRQECRTDYEPIDTIEPRVTPGRSELVGAMKPVTRTQTELERRCQMVSKPVSKLETVYTSQYDFASKSYRNVPQTRSVTRSEMQQECRLESVTKTVTRYEFQLATRFVPPSVDYLSARRLKASEPVCERVEAGDDDPPRNRIEGTIYLPGPPSQER